MDQFTIEFYKDINGNLPVEHFILSLDTKMKAKLLGILKILQKKATNWEKLTLNILVMEFLKFVLRSELIFPEFYIFSIMGE